jgi:DNA-binding NtrC family response regulator
VRVLIADDEQRYRDYLRASLAEQGHEVTTVDAGRVAIDYGVRFRPHVLVTDWMLRDHIHGLRVSNVLRAVDPSLQAIVITGFPSSDLQRDARHSGVFRFIEKPFELHEMIDAVNGAAATKHTGAIALFGLLEVDSRGRIANTNCKSREMLARTAAGPDAQRLDELFGSEAISYLVESNERWVRIQPAAREPVEWLMRSKTWPDGGILVVLPSTSESLQGDPLVETLLEVDRTRNIQWPFKDHVLVIDDIREVRSLCAQLLEQVGCVCYKAESEELAFKLFRADEEIGVVILDYEMSLDDLGAFVKELSTIRPRVKVVGTSAEDHRRAFKAMGVNRYLDKGWQLSDLISVVDS